MEKLTVEKIYKLYIALYDDLPSDDVVRLILLVNKLERTAYKRGFKTGYKKAEVAYGGK